MHLLPIGERLRCPSFREIVAARRKFSKIYYQPLPQRAKKSNSQPVTYDFFLNAIKLRIHENWKETYFLFLFIL